MTGLKLRLWTLKSGNFAFKSCSLKREEMTATKFLTESS